MDYNNHKILTNATLIRLAFLQKYFSKDFAGGLMGSFLV